MCLFEAALVLEVHGVLEVHLSACVTMRHHASAYVYAALSY